MGLPFVYIYNKETKMTKAQLNRIVKSWWDWNQTIAQTPEARYFIEQIYDWNTGFKEHTKDGWIADRSEFEVLKAKDVKEGISLVLKSGNNIIDGILQTGTGEWMGKEPLNNITGSFVLRGASIDG